MSTIAVTNLKHESASGNNITLDSSGNVGVGVSNPSSYSGKFQVATADASGWYGNFGSATTGVLLGVRGSVASVGTNGATTLILNPDGGAVRMPYQPFFYADRDTDWTGWVPSDQTQPMLYNRASVNIGGHYNTSTGLFTAPVTGVYQFWAGIYGGGTFTFEQIWPVVNGVRGTSFVVGVNATNRTGTCFVRLSAGDTFGVHGYSGASSATMTATNYHTFFTGQLIG